MTPTENLHYAIGVIAYAVATADGEIQKQEREKFHAIVTAELRCKDYDFNLSDIIFQIMEKDHTSTEEAYNSAIKEIKINSHYLSPVLKKTFVAVIEKVAKAFPPIVANEKSLIERFKEELEPLNGDPIYYNQNK